MNRAISALMHAQKLKNGAEAERATAALLISGVFRALLQIDPKWAENGAFSHENGAKKARKWRENGNESPRNALRNALKNAVLEAVATLRDLAAERGSVAVAVAMGAGVALGASWLLSGGFFFGFLAFFKKKKLQ
jgi:hypothetical protein